MKVIIVGGVAGGATTAARLRRLNEKVEIILIERGNFISFANCGLPYYIGDVIKNKKNLLLQTPESFNRRFNIDVRIKQEVIKIDRKEKNNPRFAKIYYRKYPNFIKTINNRYLNYNNEVEKVIELEKKGKIYVIRPSKELQIKRILCDSILLLKLTMNCNKDF